MSFFRALLFSISQIWSFRGSFLQLDLAEKFFLFGTCLLVGRALRHVPVLRCRFQVWSSASPVFVQTLGFALYP